MNEQEFQQYLNRVAPHLVPIIKANDRVYANAPRLVRDYQNDTVGVVCGNQKTFGGAK